MTETQSPFIKVDNLGLKTPAGPVYSGVSFEAEEGQVVAFCGSEGSGMTSLLLTLCGRMKPTSGSDNIAGLDLKKDHKRIRQMSNITIIHRVNDVPEHLRTRDIISAELMLCGKSGRKAKVKEYMEQWDVAYLADERYSNLASYDKALFNVALAMCGEPKLLMVDDIESGLTQHQGIKLMKLFKQMAAERGTTIMVGLCEYEIARYADGVVFLSEEAATQRREIIAARGASYDMPVLGCGNNVYADAVSPVSAQEGEVL